MPTPLEQAGSPTGPDDLALVERVRAGDRGAFTLLVRRHGGTLLRVAAAFVKDRPLAEELVQETWLAALQGLDVFEGRSSVRTWLLGVLLNKARTAARRAGRSVPFSALDEAADEGLPGGDRFGEQGGWVLPPAAWAEEDPERLALRAETRGVLEAAIASLGDAQRAVLTLRDVEGLPTEEICNLLGITVTNQRVLLHRARARVREALERHMAGGP